MNEPQLRRRFLALIAGAFSALIAFITGCRRRRDEDDRPFPRIYRELPDARLEKTREIRTKICARIAEHLPESDPEFDPATLFALGSFLIALFRFCAESSMLRQQAAVKASPNGRYAQRLKKRLRDRFLEENKSAAAFRADQYAAAAVKAFANATPAELKQARQDLIDNQAEPSLTAAKELADELSSIE